MKIYCLNNSVFNINKLWHLKACFLVVFFFLNSVISFSQDSNRWQVNKEGSISWTIKDKIPHYDHLEMSGKRVSAVIRYGVEPNKDFRINRTIVWPMLRTIPNDTHASLIREFNTDIIKEINVNGRLVSSEEVREISMNGILWVKSLIGKQLELTRKIFPSTELPVLLEQYELRNLGEKDMNIEIPNRSLVYTTDKNRGVDGIYSVDCKIENSGNFNLKKGESIEFSLIFEAEKTGEK